MTLRESDFDTLLDGFVSPLQFAFSRAFLSVGSGPATLLETTSSTHIDTTFSKKDRVCVGGPATFAEPTIISGGFSIPSLLC
jgi:hypothetical protein